MFIPIGTDESRPRQRFPIITVVLLLLNVAAFLYELSVLAAGGEPGLNRFIRDYGVTASSIMAGESLITLLTSQFLHGGWWHLISNMLFLLSFGDNVEDRMGPWRYIIFYLISGVLASLAQVLVDPQSTLPSIGASGAIAGLLGAYLVLFPEGQVRALVFFVIFATITRFSAVLFIVFWFILQLFNGLAGFGIASLETGGVAYFAHIGGFVSGALLVRLWMVAQSIETRT
jgi:membrane associated rhomboid family serine protease